MRDKADGRLQALPVSVVIPAYNRETTLRRALESVQAQQPRGPAQVIVVDDGSEDATADIAEQFGARLIRLSANRGQAIARNVGVRAADESWVAFLDSDDEWRPHHLATVWPLRIGHVLVGASSVRHADGLAHRIIGPLSRQPRVLTSPAEILHPHNFLTTSTVLARRDALLSVGGFRAHHGVVEDLDLWVRLLEQGTGSVSPVVTAEYHAKGPRLTDDLPRTRAGHRAVALAYEGRSWWTPTLLRRWEGASGWDEVRDALKSGSQVEAVRRLVWLVSRPSRLRGVLDLLAWRFRARRTSARVDPDGSPAIAVLSLRAENLHLVTGIAAREPASGGLLCQARAALRLARRPTAFLLVDSSRGRTMARLLGIDPLDVRRPPALGDNSQKDCT